MDSRYTDRARQGAVLLSEYEVGSEKGLADHSPTCLGWGLGSSEAPPRTQEDQLEWRDNHDRNPVPKYIK